MLKPIRHIQKFRREKSVLADAGSLLYLISTETVLPLSINGKYKRRHFRVRQKVDVIPTALVYEKLPQWLVWQEFRNTAQTLHSNACFQWML